MKTKNTIMVVDDDTRLRNLLGKFFEENGFICKLAKDTLEAREILSQEKLDLVIIDVMMPQEDGITFLKWLRNHSKIPAIILTAKGDSKDRISGLENGADDYLPKPFDPKELLLRISNILKRSDKNLTNDDLCCFGNFVFSFKDFRLKNNEGFIHITDSEIKILNILCSKIGVAVSRESLSSLLGEIDDRSIDVQITRLRRKIESNPKKPIYLQTVRNFGYVLHR